MIRILVIVCGAVRMGFKQQLIFAFAVGIGLAVAAMIFDVGVDWMHLILADRN